jgi:CBS domain-containing protein
MKVDIDHDRRRSATFDEAIDQSMSRSIAAVHDHDHVWSVLERLHLGALRHIVVLDRTERFLGVLSDRLAADYVGRDRLELECVRVRDVVFDPHTSVASGTPLGDAAHEMLRHSAGALAVVDGDRRVLGIVTGADVMRRLLVDDRTGVSWRPMRGQG